MNEQPRYLTQDVILRATKKTPAELKSVTRLTLQRQHSDPHHLNHIENLHLLPNLRELILTNHAITSFQGISTNLRLVDLSSNRITSFSQFSALSSVEILILTDNAISTIPPQIRQLQSLRELRLNGNPITAIQDISNLAPCRSLSLLSLSRTTVAELPHYRPFCIYAIPSLSHLDATFVSEQERSQARTRFEGKEKKALELKLSDQEKEMQRLETENQKNQGKIAKLEQYVINIKKKASLIVDERNALAKRFEEQNEVLKERGRELTRALGRISQLENQIAAFSDDDDVEFSQFIRSSQGKSFVNKGRKSIELQCELGSAGLGGENFDDDVARLEGIVSDLEKRNHELLNVSQENQRFKAIINDLEQKIGEKDEEIASLQAESLELENSQQLNAQNCSKFESIIDEKSALLAEKEQENAKLLEELHSVSQEKQQLEELLQQNSSADFNFSKNLSPQNLMKFLTDFALKN
ncbi:hypothetical protein P9112_011025 [Eukaryota sp. TZLM1-RC]